MIIVINKNGNEPVALGDRDSSCEDFETNNLPKGEKGKTGDIHSNGLSGLLKNSAENNNNNNGQVVGQKRPITNNDGVITLRQKFRVIRIRPRPSLTLR